MSEETESIKFDSKARRIKELPAGAQVLNLALSSEGVSTISLDNNEEGWFRLTLSNIFSLRLFGMYAVTLYENSVTADNQLPVGANIDDGDYIYNTHYDWGASDNNNIKVITWIRNQTGGTVNILYRANIRYIVEGAEDV